MIGDAKDLEALYELLGSKNERVRLNVMRALGRRGNIGTVQHIDFFLKERKEKKTKREIKDDYTVKEGENAIEEIKRRILEESDHSVK